MSLNDSALDREQIALARVLLKTPSPPAPNWAPIAAAAFAAFAALALATASLLVPASEGRHVIQISR